MPHLYILPWQEPNLHNWRCTVSFGAQRVFGKMLPSPVPQVLCRDVFGAGRFSLGGNQSRKSDVTEGVWSHACWDNAANPVQETLVECSVCLPIFFNVCVRSPWSCQTRCAAVWTARGGSFADFADFEQCAQVSPANEPSAQGARSEGSARGFNQGLCILGAELFMPALAPDQRTWYKMQISIEFLEVAPVRLCHKVQGGEWQFQCIMMQNAGGVETERLVLGEFKLQQSVKCFYIRERTKEIKKG